MENRTAGKPPKVRILVDVYTVRPFLKGMSFSFQQGVIAECDPSWGPRGKAVRKINLKLKLEYSNHQF